MRTFCLVGVRGSGKTTLANSVAEIVPLFKHVTVQSILRMLVGNGTTSFEALPDDMKKQMRRRAMMYLQEESARSKGVLLVEYYASLFNPNTRRIESVLPIEAGWFFSDLILLAPDPQMVRSRRIKDSRKPVELEIIQFELKRELEEAQAICDQSSMELHIIRDDGRNNIRKELVSILMG
jgi:adenylate kinase